MHGRILEGKAKTECIMINFSSPMLEVLEITASGAGILGAALMALRIAPPRTAYGVWILSNLIFFPYCMATSQWGVFAMNIAFLIINVAGIARWKSEQVVSIRFTWIRNAMLRFR